MPTLQIAEMQRLDDLYRRRNAICRARRVSDGKSFEASLNISDYVALIGNHVTLSTYPPDIKAKTTCFNATASTVKYSSLKTNTDAREFLWIGGGGAVMKGLDLLLELFAKRSDIRLNIVGGVAGERDFVRAFQRELFDCPNIEYHGFLDTTGDAFAAIADRCVAVINPSASEGMSSAAATALQMGMYPIFSRQTGITLPPNSGIYLDSLTVQDIETAIDNVLAMPRLNLYNERLALTNMANQQYSRENFTDTFTQFLTDIIGQKEHAARP